MPANGRFTDRQIGNTTTATDPATARIALFAKRYLMTNDTFGLASTTDHERYPPFQPFPRTTIVQLVPILNSEMLLLDNFRYRSGCSKSCMQQPVAAVSAHISDA